MYQSGSPGNKLHLELQNTQTCCNALIIDDELPQALPSKSTNPNQLVLLKDEEYELFFSQNPEQTHIPQHIIDTDNVPPVKVPRHLIPFHLVDQVQQQLEDMAQEGIIQPSSSPWCTPAVYVSKPNGELHICIDFVQLSLFTAQQLTWVSSTHHKE